MDRNNLNASNRIERVTVQGFRSLANLVALDLPQLTVLIGANGSGKSNFIKFFEMLGWMLKAKNLQEFVLRNGGGDDQMYFGARQTPAIRAEIRIRTEQGSNDYRFSLVHLSANDRLMVTNEAYRFSAKSKPNERDWSEIPHTGVESELPNKENPTAKAITRLLRQCSTFQFHDTSDRADLRKRWDISDCARLRSNGGNLAAILLDMRERDSARFTQLQWQIRRVLPVFDCFVLTATNGTVILQWKPIGHDKTLGVHLTSDGSLRLFCLMTLLSLPKSQRPDVLFLDEPELGLHPHAIGLIAELIQTVALDSQVILSTQSPYLVDCFALDNIIVAQSENGATVLKNLPKEKYQHWLDNDYAISNIWLSLPVGS